MGLIAEIDCGRGSVESSHQPLKLELLSFDCSGTCLTVKIERLLVLLFEWVCFALALQPQDSKWNSSSDTFMSAGLTFSLEFGLSFSQMILGIGSRSILVF